VSAFGDFMTQLTYGQFLALFLLPPIVGLAILVLRDHWWRGSGAQAFEKIEKSAQGASRWWLLAGLTIVAIVYTIPWDSHLIAEGVWSYAPSRVSGLMLAGIPLEELLFFPLETLLIGLWVFWLTPRLAPQRHDVPAIVRWVAGAGFGVAWLVGLLILLRGWRPGTYLGWELVWALPPLALQCGLGADVLWRRRWLVLAALAPITIYLCVIDALAIHAGIWTIAPTQSLQSLGMLPDGVLPLEEGVFFVLTSALVTGGLIMGMAPEMWRRLHVHSRRPGRSGP
jgi:lycopene beta-cyclase